jgi:hypothetical protein
MVRKGTIIIHVPLELSILINGTDYTDYLVSYRIYEEKNQMREFSASLVSVSDAIKTSDIMENKVVLFLYGKQLIMKGIIASCENKTHDFVEISGYGSLESKLSERTVKVTAAADSDSAFGRPEYTEQATNTIVTQQLAEDADVSIGTNTNLGTVNTRSEFDNKLSFIASIAENRGGWWWASHGAYPFSSDVFNISTTRGTGSVIETFDITGTDANATETSREKDTESLWNSIVFLGRGDGKNQLMAKLSHSTLKRTKLSADLTDSATTCTVVNGALLDASGTVWIGMEQCTYTVSGNTLTIVRATADGTDANSQDYLKAYAHSSGVSVVDTDYYEYSCQAVAGVSVNDYGVKTKTLSDARIISQDALDLLTTQVLDEHYQLVERITIEPVEFNELLVSPVVGDTITGTDSESGLTGNYVIYSKEITNDMGDRKITLQLDNGKKRFITDLKEVSKGLNSNTTFAQGAINMFTVSKDDNLQDFDGEFDPTQFTGTTHVWHFTDNPNSVDNTGSNQRNLTLTGTDAYASGKYGRGTNILGTTKYFSRTFSGNHPIWGNVVPTVGSVSMYVQMTNDAADSVFLETTDSLSVGGNSLFKMWYDQASDTFKAQLNVTGSSTVVTSSTNPANGTWYQIGFVWNGTSHILYVDNVAEDTNAATGYESLDTKSIIIGCSSTNPVSAASNAYVDELLWTQDVVTDFTAKTAPGYGKAMDITFQIPEDATKINSVKLSFRNVPPRTWNTTVSDYAMTLQTYTTADIQILTSDDTSGVEATFTNRTAAIETALGRALNATNGAVETSIDLTSYFSVTGWKGIRIAGDGNSRHECQVEVKCFVEK